MTTVKEEKYHLTPEELRSAIAQFLIDEGRTETTDGVMELSIDLNDMSAEVELHRNNAVH